MNNMLYKEMKLSASVTAYLFILFGLMFFIPGYPVLCGAFFSTLGLFKSFEYAREANDIVFSVLLPVAKRDVVKGRYAFACFIELCSAVLMCAVVIIRMTVLADSAVYCSNIMMNANLFALGAAFVLFGLFNLIFVGGFFITGYKTGKPFVLYMIAAFICIAVFEAVHHVPGLEVFNAFGIDNVIIQIVLLVAGILLWLLMTVFSCGKACRNFEKADL